MIQTIPDSVCVNYVRLHMGNAKQHAILYINRIRDYSLSQIDTL